ncbi:MAG: bifunctional riboflavin kinase/FMN adenylyltransferase [Kiritimatiellia bacterium]
MNLAVGFFDGLHLGHQKILERADAVLTFRNHPLTVVAPARAPALLMTRDDRLAALDAFVAPGAPGDDRVVALDFTAELAAQSPAGFAAWLETRFPALQTLFCGPNWTFGAGGAGTADFLRARGFAVETVPYVIDAGEPVSSTRIRTALAAGRMELASRLLGRPWRVAGPVVRGKGLGRTIGYPTVNVEWPAGLVRPPLGVYAVETALGRGVANFGRAPTLAGRSWPEPVLEVHLLACGDSPPAADRLSVSFLRFLRPETAFPTVGDLRRQIADDVERAKSVTI